MNIILLDYTGKQHTVSIPDDTEEIKIMVVSGDMIMFSPIFFDTDIEHTRKQHFDDGEYTITKDKFQALSSLTSSYDLSSLSDD